ncbi:ALQxL family class IV lanthipeptide [Streptomyces chartreusis]
MVMDFNVDDLQLLPAEQEVRQLAQCTRTCEGTITCAVTCIFTQL